MGVDISALVHGAPLRLADLNGKAVAIDAFNTLYQFLTTIRQPDGTPLKDRNGRVTSHLSGMFHRSGALLELGVRPAFVFDGKPPKLKERTLEIRRKARETAEREWKAAVEAGDLKKALTKASQSTRLDDDMISETKSLLDSMGIPWLVAPSEGEAQIGLMAMKGDVWAGASQDFDSLLFGTPTLVRNLTLSRKRKTGSGRTVDVEPELVELRRVLDGLQLTRQQLVDMSILIGTDFNKGVHGIGPKRALKIIRELGSLEEVAVAKRADVPEDFSEVRKVFLEPDVTEQYSLKWSEADDEGVRRILCDRHGFSVDRVDSVLSRVHRTTSSKSQSCLDSWG
ncbi:MAG: flap endonuclease-1 [Thermoplasmata archaeon]|nr:flap endonuclease-1 [Thermoplasmata archaeon]